jgi:hypothetical protein
VNVSAISAALHAGSSSRPSICRCPFNVPARSAGADASCAVAVAACSRQTTVNARAAPCVTRPILCNLLQRVKRTATRRASPDRIDVNHLHAVLPDERAAHRHLFVHPLQEKRLCRLMVLQAGGQVQVALRVEHANRVACLCAGRGARLLRRAAVACFEVAPEVDCLAGHRDRFTCGLAGHDSAGQDHRRREQQGSVSCVSHRGPP